MSASASDGISKCHKLCDPNNTCDDEGCSKCCNKVGESSVPAIKSNLIQRSCVPLPLPAEQLKELVADARDYALLHGAGMRYPDSYSVDTLSMAPFFLLPTPFPRRDFEKVYKLQPLINKLMHEVAHDHDFLTKCLQNTIKVDSFTRQLWEIYTTVREEGVRQPVSLALLRCDVLLDTPPCDNSPNTSSIQSQQDSKLNTECDGITPNKLQNHLTEKNIDCESGNAIPETVVSATSKCSRGGLSPLSPMTMPKLLSMPSVLCCSAPKQVEVNTIASSFAGLAGKLRNLQQYVLNLMGRQDLVANLPANDALSGLCCGMIAAWDHYKRPASVILFIVEDISYNICDQRFHEYEILKQRPEVRVLRRSLTQVHHKGALDAEGRLWLHGNMEVAVVYFRCGYDPSGYHGPNEWAARLMIERSVAIKCPSIHYHLAGTKKVQQELAAKGALLPFLSPDEARDVGELFTGLYTLDMGPEGDQSVAMAVADPDRFVLKPQREGGGNNLYGADIRETLERIGKSSDREAYILMDRIRAPVQTNYLVRPQKEVILASVISELGIFGALMGSSSEIFLNKTCGHMLRSKLSTNNEGGVASGNGALDSVLLVD